MTDDLPHTASDRWTYHSPRRGRPELDRSAAGAPSRWALGLRTADGGSTAHALRRCRSRLHVLRRGSEHGALRLLAAAMFEPGAVDAFEPTPATASVLRRAVEANDLDIDVVEAAVGDRNGSAELHYSAKSDASNSMVEGFKESSSSVSVTTIRLDDHARERARDPHIMKIDVETFEPAVLAGAVETIARARPYIVIEVLNRRGHDHGVEITEAMAPFGYSYYELAATPMWQPRPTVNGRAKLAAQRLAARAAATGCWFRRAVGSVAVSVSTTVGPIGTRVCRSCCR